MFRRRNRLTSQQQRYLQTTLNHFMEDGRWPTLGVLSRELVREMEVADVDRLLPSGLIWGWQYTRGDYRPEREIQLTFTGILHCMGADELLASFPSTVRLCSEKYLDHTNPTPQLSSEELQMYLSCTSKESSQVRSLLQQEGFLGGGWQSEDGRSWLYDIRETARQFADVPSLERYGIIRAEILRRDRERQLGSNSPRDGWRSVSPHLVIWRGIRTVLPLAGNLKTLGVLEAIRAIFLR